MSMMKCVFPVDAALCAPMARAVHAAEPLPILQTMRRRAASCVILGMGLTPLAKGDSIDPVELACAMILRFWRDVRGALLPVSKRPLSAGGHGAKLTKNIELLWR